ncbi:PREDICTED: apolipophorins [Dinoponera quadriceps]|uniref:Apolipophorins n=1 Tax=Dinoponera quadriceps TaxID=609295 RepID=A0A6P3YAU3_DINQU|nr:PREDICTED: apolipophorins [Dinoponera quadriceps]
MGLARAAVIAACLLLFLATDASGSKCSVGCRGLHGGKAYKEGHTYVYDLEGTSVTSVPEAQNEATLKLKGTVELSVKPDCIRQIRLKDVQINGAPISQPDVEQYALQFNYHDGHIDTEVCAEEGDSQASLNIKRAMASLFQTAVFQDFGSTSHHEVDVFGGCPTDFTFRKDGDSLTVRKERNLARCSHREHILYGPVSVMYDHSDILSSPLLSSEQSIEQRLKHGVLNKVSSVETYELKPFSNGDAGAKTVVRTTLTLKSEKGDSPKAEVSQPKSLIFEAPHPVIKSSVDSIATALKAASVEEIGTVQQHAAEKFAELVRVLGYSNKNDILAVYQKVRAGAGFDKVTDKKILLDALFRTGSGEAAEAVVELMKGHELSGQQTLLFYASLALVRHVHLPSVTVVTSLLDQPDLPRLGYLGVGQVIGKYCQEHSCENVAEVKQAIHKIREKIGNGKAKTREQEDLVVSALKALGNTKYLDDSTLVKLAGIAEDKNVRNRVRVAAIETLPARCSMKSKNILIKVMADRDEDSEIRIKSYLSLIACPCQHFASALKDMLDKEEVNQVGSFIQSHLRNLRASTDPTKADAKHHVGKIKPRTKFPEDFRKYSFNNELSYHMGGLGVGSAVESNVIYSQNSYVPRSVNLNLTAELFGRSFNFLEMNTRMENLDRMIEHYFGPKGHLTQGDVDDMVEKGVHDAVNIGEYIEEKMKKLRGKREVKQGELDRFAKGVKLRNNEVDQQLDIDLSIKLFGVEMYYLTHSSEGDHAKEATPKQLIDKIFDSLDVGMNKLKKFDHHLKSHMQLLDLELIYPTNLGAPFMLNVISSGVMLAKIYGKIDARAIMENPQNAELYFGFDPSISVQVTGSMLVKAFDAESGMKVVFTLHSNTANDFKIKMLDGKGIDFSIGTPMQNEKTLFVSSEVLMSSGQKNNAYEAAKFGTKGKIYDDCFDQITPLTGISLCGHVEFPYDGVEAMKKRALFPLNGHSKFRVNFHNQDNRYYRLKIFYDNKSEKTRTFELIAETPGSKTQRRISLTAEAGLEPDKYVRVNLDSSFKKASAEAVLKNTAEEHTFTIKVNHDQQEYYGRAGLLANGAKYKPVLEYKVPEHIEKLSGGKIPHGKQHYNVDGIVELVEQDGGRKYVFDKVVLMMEGRKIVGVDGYIMSAHKAVAMDMNLGYGDESLALKMDLKKLGAEHYSLCLSAVPSRNPNIGFDLDLEYRNSEYEFENKLVFVHGPDLKSEVNRFTMKQEIIAKPKQSDGNFLFSASSKISYPALKLVFDMDGKLTAKSIEGDIDMSYNKFKFGTELSMKRNMAKKGDYEVEFEAELLQNSMKLQTKRTVIDPHKNRYKHSVELKPGGKYESDMVITCHNDKNKMDVEVDGNMNLNGKKVKTVGALKAESGSIDCHAIIAMNDVKYVNFLLKSHKSPNPHSKLVLNLKNYLNVDGEMLMQGDKGNAHLTIDLPKTNRKIKGIGDLVVAGTLHTASVQLLLDAERDPSKVIKLTTVTDLKKNTIDSKNMLDLLGHKIEVNGKGKLEGTLNEGELIADVDVTLPNGRYLVYKVKRTSSKKEKEDNYDIHVDALIEDHKTKGGESIKVTYVANVHEMDFKTYAHTGDAKLQITDYDGNSKKLEIQSKNLPGINGYKDLFEIKLTGIIGPQPLNLEYKGSELDSGEESEHFAASFGKFQLKSTANYIPGDENDKPYAGNGNVELLLPSEKLRNLKLDYKVSYLDQPKKNHEDLQYEINLIYNDDKSIKLESFSKSTGTTDTDQPHSGDYKVALTLHNNPPIVFHDTFNYMSEGDKIKITRKTTGIVDGKETTIIIDNLTYNNDLSSIHLSGKAVTPYEHMNNVDFSINHESSQDGLTTKTEGAVTADNDKYTTKCEIQRSNISPKIHIIFTSPNGKTELLSKYEKLGDHEYTGELKIDTPKGFAVADTHLKLDNIDNFIINTNFDSDKLKHRKIHAEIANNPTAKAGRRIVITVTSDGKNIVTGSTSYKRRDEAGKIIVEGNGNLKIGENMRSSSFKYSRQQLTREKDGESGVVIVLNAKFDPVAIVSDLKFSNREVLISNSYCEQSKDCAHFKLQSTYDTDNKEYLKHQLTVEVDLKKFNVPVEFGLKTSTENKENSFDHSANLYLHSSKDKSEYTYHVYIHPKESGAVLTLPTRELAVIGTYDIPKTKQGEAFKIDLNLYLDRKNKPNEKTGFAVYGDSNIDKDSVSINGEIKFIYPTQTKDMVVKGRLYCSSGEHLLDANMDIDLFNKKTQKITLVAKVNQQIIDSGYNITSVIDITSRGQHLKIDLKSHAALTKNAVSFGSFLSYLDRHQKPKNAGILFTGDSSEMYFLVTALNKEIIRADAKMQLQKNLQKIDAEVAVIGSKPVVMNFEAHDFNNFKFSEYQQDNPNTKLTADGRFVIGQMAEIHADSFKDGAKKHLFRAMIHLDEGKFLKPDFTYDKDNIIYVIEQNRHQNAEMMKQLKGIGDEIENEIQEELKDLVKHLDSAKPNTKQLQDYYQTELIKLNNEIHADQTFKDIQASFGKRFKAIIAAITDTFTKTVARYGELSKQFREIASKLRDAVETVLPQLKKLYNEAVDTSTQILDAIVSVAMAYLKAALNLIDEHQKELKELAVMVSELVQDIAKVIYKAATQIKKDVDEFVELLVDQVKALPVYEIVKEKYNEILKFQIPESIMAPIEEFFNVIKNTLPTDELRHFVDTLQQYLMKHAKQEKVDDIHEIKKIYTLGVDAIQSLATLLGSEENMDNLFDLLIAGLIDIDSLTNLPAITTLKVSFFELLNNRELPTLADLYYTYRPTLIPMDIVPPFTKIGLVVDGGHFFTFDGKSFSMPGDCSYILAQDMLDGNFSIIANFNKGSLISMTVTEPKESITLKNNGDVLINNKPAEFPAKTKNLHASLLPSYHSASIESDYGVVVMCTHKTTMICAIEVSGFYNGRIRGLFGDGNNEHHDDYTLPSGKITESETEFANGYKLKPDCPAVNAIDHKQRNPICTEYFSGQKSSLKRCFNYVNPSAYRDACDKAASTNPQAPCQIAVAYNGACEYSRVSGINIPSACVTCKVGEHTINVDDSFSVKAPKDQADIMLVIEQDVRNEKIFKDLVPALITDLKEELKHHGITDVHIGLMGYGEKMDTPQFYTVGGNLNIEGDVKNIKFEKSDPILSLEEAKEGDIEKKLEYIGQKLDMEFGTFKLTDAYLEGVRYPYRPGAVRAVVGIIVTPCEKSPFPLSLQSLRILQGLKAYRDRGLTYHHIYQPGDIQVSGKTQKNIVAYDHDSAYVLADNKRKPLSGNSELRHNLVLPAVDVCADFAITSGGAAYISTNLLDAKPNQKKQFAQVTARRIVESLTDVELEQDCVCQHACSLSGIPRCKIVGRREKEHLAKHTKGGVKG